MLHRALFGSYERFIGLLIEHYAGNFPVWLSPVQVSILPVSERHADYAYAVLQELKDAGIRATVDDANETLGKRIRNSELLKNPYTLVVGDKEIETGKLAVRSRGQQKISEIEKGEFISSVKEDIANRNLELSIGGAE